MSLEYNINFITDKSKKSTIKKAISILEKAFFMGIEVSSFFLDPFDREIISSIAKKNNIELYFIGANEHSERKIFVANPYFIPLIEENYIKVLRFERENINHPDVLGSLINLGIKRSEIGDISILNKEVEFAILENQASFIKYNLSKIKNERINIDFKKNNNLIIEKPSYESYKGFVSSLRLDNIISNIASTSREKSKQLIKNKYVKVNYQIITDPSFTIDKGSSISIRKMGRFIFDEVLGKSKKDKFHIEYRKLV